MADQMVRNGEAKLLNHDMTAIKEHFMLGRLSSWLWGSNQPVIDTKKVTAAVEPTKPVSVITPKETPSTVETTLPIQAIAEEMQLNATEIASQPLEESTLPLLEGNLDYYIAELEKDLNRINVIRTGWEKKKEDIQSHYTVDLNDDASDVEDKSTSMQYKNAVNNFIHELKKDFEPAEKALAEIHKEIMTRIAVLDTDLLNSMRRLLAVNVKESYELKVKICDDSIEIATYLSEWTEQILNELKSCKSWHSAEQKALQLAIQLLWTLIVATPMPDFNISWDATYEASLFRRIHQEDMAYLSERSQIVAHLQAAVDVINEANSIKPSSLKKSGSLLLFKPEPKPVETLLSASQELAMAAPKI